MKTEYFSTDDVCLILHQRKADIIRACIDHKEWCILRNSEKERLFVAADINKLWKYFYGGRLKVKSVERVADKFDLRLSGR